MKQREALQAIIGNNEKLDDENTVKRNYNYFIVERKDDDTIKSFTLNEKKIASAKKICGFHTLITLMLDMTPMEASENYALRDELEKCHRQMKSTQGCNRQNYWSEEGKTGRLLILFVSLVLSSYEKYIWKSTELKEKFSSSLDILDEMRSIRCIEHNGKAKFITPFAGKQIDIAEAFGFEIPDGCGKKYKSKRVKTKKGPGRPRKPKVVSLDS